MGALVAAVVVAAVAVAIEVAAELVVAVVAAVAVAVVAAAAAAVADVARPRLADRKPGPTASPLRAGSAPATSHRPSTLECWVYL